MSLSLREFRPRCDEVSRDARLFNTAHSAEPSFSILHFQFSILHTPNSNKQQKRAVSRPLFCVPKHQHAPFSEQNLTSLPSRIIFVVRTAHILPHIEQV